MDLAGFEPAPATLTGCRAPATPQAHAAKASLRDRSSHGCLSQPPLWISDNRKTIALRFGGNDVGSVMLEENVVRAGVTNCTTEEELRRTIRDDGFKPVQRDTLYRTYFLNSAGQQTTPLPPDIPHTRP